MTHRSEPKAERSKQLQSRFGNRWKYNRGETILIKQTQANDHCQHQQAYTDENLQQAPRSGERRNVQSQIKDTYFLQAW